MLLFAGSMLAAFVTDGGIEGVRCGANPTDPCIALVAGDPNGDGAIAEPVGTLFGPA
jgi:hypothetical protein